MDQSTVVTEQVEDGQKLLDALVASGMMVDAAFWAWPVDEERWYLYLVSPLVDLQGPLAGYRKVREVLESLGNLFISTSQIKVLGSTDSTSLAILKITEPLIPNSPFAVANPQRYRGMTSIGHSVLGGLEVDGASIYPPVAYAVVH